MVQWEGLSVCRAGSRLLELSRYERENGIFQPSDPAPFPLSPSFPIMVKGGLQKRVLRALQCAIDKDLEECFFHLAPAIDITSRRHFPLVSGQRDRFIRWIDLHQADMFRIATLGHFVLHGGFGRPGSEAVERIANALYKARNAATHNPDELEDLILFSGKEEYGFIEGRFIITQGMLIALTLLVFSDPTNKSSFNPNHIRNTWVNWSNPL